MLQKLNPELQLSFWVRFQAVQDVFFQSALQSTVDRLGVKTVDEELHRLVPEESLTKLATYGLRGEAVFMLPSVLRQQPQLYGYYRLLFGFSQKEMSTLGYGRFAKLETDGLITSRTDRDIEAVCTAFIECACIFLDESSRISLQDIRDLQILTLGPQFRGSRNNTLGQVAAVKVFQTILEIVKPYEVSHTDSQIVIENVAKRTIIIEFASDPDIVIQEQIGKRKRKLVSIEIKGGTDFSNIHNRVGEAEKSHQKAKNDGYSYFYTIIAVETDYGVLLKESPTTNLFFNIRKLQDTTSEEYGMFRDELFSILSIG